MLLSAGRLLLLILILVLFSAPVWAGPASGRDEIARKYEQAKTSYQELISNDKGRDRNRWLAIATSFRGIYKAAPGHQDAPRSLFMVGKIFQALFRQSGKAQDLEQAIAAYEEIGTRYPGNALADDAFFLLGGIYFADKNDSSKAARAYAKIIALYPAGDMAEAAAAQLVQIKRAGVRPGSISIREGEKCLPSKTDEEPPQKDLAAAKSGMVTVLPIRHWSNNRYTRLVIETSGPVIFKHQALNGDKSSQRRIYLDLQNSRLSPKTVKLMPIEDGLLRQVRNSQFDAKTVRIVLDTQANIADYKIFTLTDPFRVVIDVLGSDAPSDKAEKPDDKGGQVEDKARKEAVPPLARQVAQGIKRIVIDPGHGGKDPGACSPGGLKEKDIVLEVALRVVKALREKPGYEVILTRDRDIFIPLEERTAIANAREADLFLSIHVNAAPNHEARGVETYVLDRASSKDAMRLAARENATSTRQINNLQAILLDLMHNSKLNESLKLAGLVQGTMVGGLNQKFSDVPNLGVKKAPFAVLIGARMPAILTEIAFLSNQEEEKRLQSEAYLAEVAHHLAAGVVQYVDNMSLALQNKRYSVEVRGPELPHLSKN